MSLQPPLPGPDAVAGGPLPQGGDPLAEVLARLRTSRKVIAQNLKGGARGYLLAQLARRLETPLVCVTADDEAAEQLAADLAFFLGGEGSLLEPTVLHLPSDEVHPYDELSPDAAVVAERMGALFHLSQGTPFDALVLSRRALMRKVVPRALLQTLSARVRAGQEHERDELARKLAQMGYQSVPLVEDPGTFSVRGGILDVYSPLYPRPVRLEFFGDTVESLRAFDPETQRTIAAIAELIIAPAREIFFNDETRKSAELAARAAAERVNIPSTKVRELVEKLREGIPAFGLEALWPGFFEGGLGTVFDYLPSWANDPLFYLDDPVEQERAAEELWTDLTAGFEASEAQSELSFPPEAHYLTEDQLREKLAKPRRIEGGGLALSGGEESPVVFNYGTTRDLREAILSHHGEEGALSPLVDRLTRWRELKVAVAIACGTASQADRLKRLLLDRGVTARAHTEPLDEPGRLFEPSVHAHLFTGEVSHGFVDGPGGFALLTDEEIFGARSRRQSRTRRADTPFAQAFRELKEGDLIVHKDFGIGRYEGLTKMTVMGVPGDFLILQYAGRDKIYLPVSRMRLIQKFTGADPTKVALDKLGTATWEKTKRRVKENLLKMAAELVRLYAARKAHPGHSFNPPDRYFRQFEADFAFEETPDQARAIEQVLVDMQKPEPMDRLVCGDVGYGKTEVAMRAAFKAALDHKQTAVLVPTTVLAQQHYQSFKKRFAGYPVNIEVVSGMRKAGENREVMRRAREGKVDILIGTHKLLGNDVSFKDLGLLVVDEEQRFGVKHKEQIKRLRTQVDVLTLTATPIPRTLNMAMSGLRDLSIIATPPQDRRSIRTFVIKFDQQQIREAILREVQRGGQVFFVHNRVQSIHAMEKLLAELVPEVKVCVGHGQMHQGELEKVMAAFIDRKCDVLLSTAIIESGIDIASANTMIVNRADQFGLAQLYQLRGRVGRSKERAYAYLLVPPRKGLTRDAQRRLEVLQQFTELGAGFSIASHDLEIRGAGNLLGEGQSGSIAAIGLELYTQLLEEAVAEMRGEELKPQVEPDVTLPLAALIPDDYVPDVHQRLVFYKRFSEARTPDELQELRGELVDRYGEVPDEVDNLTELMSLKIEMRDLGLRGVEAGPGRLVVTLGSEARLDPLRIATLVQRSKGVYRLTPEMKLVAKLAEHIKGLRFLEEARKVLRDLGTAALPD